MSTNDDAQREFEAFMTRREAAARAYVRGDAAPLAALAALHDPATFFGPGGGHRNGARDVLETYTRDATAFEEGSETHFEILHMAASGGLGYWTGFQHARARMRGRDEPIAMKLRVTEVFRREAGTWRLVHRHADMLSEPSR